MKKENLSITNYVSKLHDYVDEEGYTQIMELIEEILNINQKEIDRIKKQIIADIDIFEFTNIIRQNLSPNQIQDEIKMFLINKLGIDKTLEEHDKHCKMCQALNYSKKVKKD